MPKRPMTTPPNGERHVTGMVELRPIDSVTKNSWNPNTMSAEQREALRYGLINDGWLASQTLLVWGSDETGQRRMVIIDGEHRWTEARAVGFTEAPMVILEGLTEIEAKRLTVKLGRKRGDGGAAKMTDLAALLLEIAQKDRAVAALDLGFGRDQMVRMLDTNSTKWLDPGPPPGGRASTPPASGMQSAGVTTLSFKMTPAEKADVLAALDLERGQGSPVEALVRISRAILKKRGAK